MKNSRIRHELVLMENGAVAVESSIPDPRANGPGILTGYHRTRTEILSHEATQLLSGMLEYHERSLIHAVGKNWCALHPEELEV